MCEERMQYMPNTIYCLVRRRYSLLIFLQVNDGLFLYGCCRNAPLVRAIWFMGAKNLSLKTGRRVVKVSQNYDRFHSSLFHKY
jgi:hypothetical protein